MRLEHEQFFLPRLQLDICGRATPDSFQSVNNLCGQI